jgi:hypothetical protein
MSNGLVPEVVWIVVEVGGVRVGGGRKRFTSELSKLDSGLVRPCDVAKTEFFDQHLLQRLANGNKLKNNRKSNVRTSFKAR